MSSPSSSIPKEVSLILLKIVIEDGVNIDNWTFPALTRAVDHFIRSEQPGYI